MVLLTGVYIVFGTKNLSFYMKPSYFIFLPLLILSCHSEDKESLVYKRENKRITSQKSKDSSWTYNEYKSENLSIDITNHNLQNFSIDVHRKRDSLRLDLNELNTPFKTPSLDWVNPQMICISTWWSGPFSRKIFIPLKGKLQEFIYIDKDIRLTDSKTNRVVYMDTVIKNKRMILIIENLRTRRKQSIELNLPTMVDQYPYYDSLSINNSSLQIWINRSQKNIALNGLE